MLGGIIGAAAAAVPGLIDWATLAEPAIVKVANWHARVNIITLVIFVASFYLRTTSGAAWIPNLPLLPFILSVVGLIGLTIAGWLGGELVFKHGLAVTAKTQPTHQKADERRHIRAA
jgi:uncharacterized membrane protein